MFYRHALASTLLAFLTVASVQATVLTYDLTPTPDVTDMTPDPIPADYGDRVTSTSMAGGSGTYGYANFGEGFSPDVVADHGNAEFWDAGYGDLTNVAYAPDGMFSLRLTADPGFHVMLFSFELAAFGTDQSVDSITVFVDGVQAFAASGSELDVSSTGHNTFNQSNFGGVLEGQEIVISFQNGVGTPDAPNVGIDNVQFVPEPSVTALALSAAGLALVVRRFRRRRS